MDYKTAFPDIPPGKKRIKKIYLSIMLFFVGRAFQSAYRVDRTVRKEFDSLPENFSFIMKIHPAGPGILMQRNNKGKLKYMGRSAKPADVNIIFRNIESAIKVFTFQSSAYVSYAQNGISVSGDLACTMSIMRSLSLVEDYLLPWIITRKIFKRSTATPFFTKHINRVRIYTGILFNF